MEEKKMKKQYMKPSIEVINVMIQHHLLNASEYKEGTASGNESLSREDEGYDW